MNKKNFNKMMRTFGKVYGKGLSVHTLRIYFNLFEKIPNEKTDFIIKECIKRYKYLPRPAEVFECLEEREKNIDDLYIGKANVITNFWLLNEFLTKEDVQKLRSMEYSDFLQTSYWQIVSSYVRYKEDRCHSCNSKENLNVHHKTYEYRGEEYLDWRKSLIVLCENCHGKFHDELRKLNDKNK